MGMPPSGDVELTELIQVRVSRAALSAIKKAAKDHALSMSAYLRQAIYREVGLIR